MTFKLDDIPVRSDKVAIITGANTGLGFETALNFAQRNIIVVMACRTELKALQAIKHIENVVPGARLHFLPLDLADLQSVETFAQRFRESFAALDILVNNAGIMVPPYTKTVDGFESQMGANYLGHFLLTALLLDLMPDSPESRVVSLSSKAHTQGMKRIRFEDIHWHTNYSAYQAYCQSKLACLMFAIELQRRLDEAGKQVRSVAAHPGVSDTDLARYVPKLFATVLRFTLLPLITHPPENAALPQTLAALSPDIKGGTYLGPTGFQELKGPPGKARVMRYAKNTKAGKQLWDVSEALTGTEFLLETPSNTEVTTHKRATTCA